MCLIKKGGLATLYDYGVDEGLVIVAEHLPFDPECPRDRVRVVQGDKDRVVDLLRYSLIPVSETDLCET